MSRFEQVWAGEREPRLQVVPRVSGDSSSPVSGDGAAVVDRFRAWTERLMAEAGNAPTVRSLSLRKLHLTEHYRQALHQAPQEGEALFAIWDAAYRTLELLHWQVAPPSIDPPAPPPEPTYEELRQMWRAAKRARKRAEAPPVYWQPMGLTDDEP
ncbi:MAG: hypothetical protein ACRDJW_01250 [Thermomicrobiales bacterium]